MSLTTDDLAVMIYDLQQQVAAQARANREQMTVIYALLAQHGDPTHVSITRAAEIKGVSRRTMQRKVTAGEFTLEIDPQTGEKGIPITQLYGGWISLETARSALAREARPAGGKVTRRRHGSSR